MIEPPALSEIQEAAVRLRGVVRHIPLIPLHGFEQRGDILLKPEIHQAVGSFKIRGVYHAVASLAAGDRAKGLSTVSAGNTAQALAWTGRHFGVPTVSLMPDSAPSTKIDAVRAYGGKTRLVPISEVFRFLKERLWEREPHAFIHPWTSRDVMIGHGSLGLEILADAPDVATVYVPVGGGGLIGGVASALKGLRPSVRVVAVEPEGCPALHESIRQGRPATVTCKTICDGVAVPYITDEVFGVIEPLIDDVVLVSEEAVRACIKRLAMGNHIIVEGAGALAAAAALDASRRATPKARRGPSVCLVTGGSIDMGLFVSILGDPDIAPL